MKVFMKDDVTESTAERLRTADHEAAQEANKYKDHVHEKLFFQELSKDMLASIKQEIRKTQDVSEAKLETLARSDPKWVVFRRTQMEVLREAGRKQMDYETAQRKWETERSNLSLKKAEVNRFGDR